MINIISTQANNTVIRGPYKVYANLVKGLERIGYPYVVNRDINSTDRLWVHDDIEALRCLPFSRAKAIVGPNLFFLPTEIPDDIRLKSDCLYLQPSAWPIEHFRRLGFNQCALQAWPVGIDTDEFHPSQTSASHRQVLVYHKKRSSQELAQIINLLCKKGIRYRLVIYGEYKEKEYQEILSDTSFIVWHGCHESQGIALQEAMSCNIPLLVWNSTLLSQPKGTLPFPQELYDIPVTSVPYFDHRCGLVFDTEDELTIRLEQIGDTWQEFSPREYILKNLSLEGQAREFINLWGNWGLTYERGFCEPINNTRSFSIPWQVRLRRLYAKLKKRF
jgi:hypothetical protein